MCVLVSVHVDFNGKNEFKNAMPVKMAHISSNLFLEHTIEFTVDFFYKNVNFKMRNAYNKSTVFSTKLTPFN